MNRRRFLLAALTIAAAPALAASDDPTAPVRAGYEHQAAQAKAREPVPVWNSRARDRLFSSRLAGLLAAEDRTVKETGEIGAIGYDPFLNGQDGAVRNLVLKEMSRTNGKAVVQATFRALNRPQTVTFDMVSEGGAWRIADIVGSVEGERLSFLTILAESYPDQK